VDRSIEDWRRDQVAAGSAAHYPPQPVQFPGEHVPLRSGVARITADNDDGTYKITEQWWDPQTEAWDAAYQPYAHVSTDARDVNGRKSGAVDQRVPFWEERGKDGTVHLIIDVFETGDDTWIQVQADGTICHIGPGDSSCCGGSKNNMCFWVTHIDGDAKGHLREFTVVDTVQVPEVYTTYSFV